MITHPDESNGADSEGWDATQTVAKLGEEGTWLSSLPDVNSSQIAKSCLEKGCQDRGILEVYAKETTCLECGTCRMFQFTENVTTDKMAPECVERGCQGRCCYECELLLAEQKKDWLNSQAYVLGLKEEDGIDAARDAAKKFARPTKANKSARAGVSTTGRGKLTTKRKKIKRRGELEKDNIALIEQSFPVFAGEGVRKERDYEEATFAVVDWQKGMNLEESIFQGVVRERYGQNVGERCFFGYLREEYARLSERVKRRVRKALETSKEWRTSQDQTEEIC